MEQTEIIKMLFRNGYLPYNIENITRVPMADIVMVTQPMGDVPRAELLNPASFDDKERTLLQKNTLWSNARREYTRYVKEGNPVQEVTPIVADTEVDEIALINDILKGSTESREDIVRVEREKLKTLLKEPDLDGKCSVCKGLGFYTIRTGVLFKTKVVVCPKCKGTRPSTEIVKTEITNDMLEEYIDNRRYRMESYSRDLLERESPLPRNMVNDNNFYMYIEDIEEIMTDYTRDLPKKSYILTAPDDFSKKFVVYHCMKEVLSKGKKPSKLLELIDLQQLLFEQEYQKVTDLLDVDALFITMSSQLMNYSYILQKIMTIADNKGIPVLLITRYDTSLLYSNHDSWLQYIKPRTKDYDFGHFEQHGIRTEYYHEITKILGGSNQNIPSNSNLATGNNNRNNRTSPRDLKRRQ